MRPEPLARNYATFKVPPAATGEDLADVFRRISEECRQQKLTRALVIAAGDLVVSRSEVATAIAALDETCRHGFRLACVIAEPKAFEEFARAEDVGLRSGIAARVFFDEENAIRWLGW